MRSTESRSADFATEPVTLTTPAVVATVIANGFVCPSAARRDRTSSVIAASSRWTTGARPTHPVAPISIVIDGMGLNCTGFSYHGTMWICAVSCREMLPDPARFADCLRESFADLKQAAERRAAESVAESVPVVRKRSARRAPAKARSRRTAARKKA